MATLEELIKMQVVYTVEGIDRIRVIKDITYKEINGEPLHMDIYLPAEIREKAKLPAVILVHGEASVKNIKDWGQYTSLGPLLAASGLIAVTFNHRMLSHGHSITDVIGDIENVYSYLIKNASNYSLDGDKLGVWSISAGTPFGLYTGFQQTRDFVKCLVVYYGYTELKLLGERLNAEISREENHKFSPLHSLSADLTPVPMLIARAGLDRPELNISLDQFISKALALNWDVDVYNHATGRHAFDILDDTQRTRTILEKTITFLKEHLL